MTETVARLLVLAVGAQSMTKPRGHRLVRTAYFVPVPDRIPGTPTGHCNALLD
jgi:hypothetical protein